jgi:NAD(P)-dependent dehydrogenase (short-subunit alcohol dehydrogenase family)
VVVVTGGGSGIGAAAAEELGRLGSFVVTADPLVSVDGAERLAEPEQTTADRIVAAGGSALASAVSVTDAAALAELFGQLAERHGGLDAVVNVAGITRKSGFAEGSEQDWRALLEVHLGGFLNVLSAALPLMADAGRGHVLGVTSGAGWRPGDAGGYGCAKRVVAALTWQLGPALPPGVTLNAVSPIAATRMVAAALERARQEGRAGGGGGLSLHAMPGPEALAPLVAHLVSDAFGWCSGRVLFAGGSELALVDEPRLLEVVRTSEVVSLRRVLDEVIPRALVPAEAAQATSGGGNPRFGAIFDEPAPAEPAPPASPGAGACAVVCDRPQLAASIASALEARSFSCRRLGPARGFDQAAAALRGVAGEAGPLDALVVALAGRRPAGGAQEEPGGWRQVLAEHAGIVDDLHTDAAWARAAADHSARSSRPLRLVTLTDATTTGGRSRAQAAAHLSRAAAGATGGRVSAFAVGVEAPEEEAAAAAAQLVAHLVGDPAAAGLAGAELVVGSGWLGLRSHPRPLGSVTYGGPRLPAWLDGTLREMVGAPPGAAGAPSP